MADTSINACDRDELFENAPCGYVTTDAEGAILYVNRRFEQWTGHTRNTLLTEGARFQDLLTPGGRIYYETHIAPLLQMQGEVREIAVEILTANGRRMDALLNAVLDRDGAGRPRLIRSAIFNATQRRLYERELLSARRREQEIAHALQHSLLAGKMPSAEQVDIEVVYQPGVADLEVGGDWYDAFWLQEGRILGLVIGDVVGHGLEAAVTMGQLRSALRALASTGLRPSALLQTLDTYARRHEVGEVATVIYAELDVLSGLLRFACAGHPPPLIVASGGEARFLWEGRSPPLAVGSAGRARAESSGHLAPGSTLLLFTDGLIERRTSTPDEDLDRLLVEASRQRLHVSRGAGGSLVRALRDPESADDLSLLLVRRSEMGSPANGPGMHEPASQVTP